MDGSAPATAITEPRAADDYVGPPDHRAGQRHAAYPDLSHDEIERFNFLAQMNHHLTTRMLPNVESAWEARVQPRFEAEHGRAPADRHEVRRALLADPTFRTWSALKRATMEQRQQAGRWAALRQAQSLAAKAAMLTGADRLMLDPSLPIPRYVSAVDHHCMPGSYHKEMFPGDVSGPANYDSGIHVTVGGRGGPLNDAIGSTMAAWIRETYPAFEPRRILDLGTTTGHNLLPMARAFPAADVIGVDIGAPVLRYAAARAEALGVDNVRFVQADATRLGGYADGSFDLIMTTMFLHELSRSSMDAIFRESRRLLAPGGMMLNMEQPSYAGMPMLEQAMRDWDSFYNNEPFWTTLHGLDLKAHFIAAGFDDHKLIHVEFPLPAGSPGGATVAMVFVGARR